MTQAWDTLSETFDVHKREGDIDPAAADNMLIAWPPIVGLINTYFSHTRGLRALDYGCGTGGFTQKLATLGFETIGIDSSQVMIEKAQQAEGSDIQFIIGDAEDPLTIQPVDVVSAIMVFQFIKDIHATLTHLTNVMKQEGLMVFAVHNPAYVRRCLEAGVRFGSFNSQSNPNAGVWSAHGVEVPVYIRTAQVYTDLMRSFSFRKILEVYPPFTAGFLAHYPENGPTDVSEYLVLGFTK